MIAFQLARWIHILAGCVALGSFWLPLVVKKGGALHRRAGWAYVAAILVITLSGVVNSVRMLSDASPANDRAAVFLLYVALLTGATMWGGVRAIASKKRTGRARGVVDFVLPSLLAAAGLALVVWGLSVGAPLFVIFALLGVFVGGVQLRFLARAPATRLDWLFQHIAGMGGSCIATVTAFLVVNAFRFGLAPFHLAVWTAPGIVGGVAIALTRRHYARKLAAPAATAGIHRSRSTSHA